MPTYFGMGVTGAIRLYTLIVPLFFGGASYLDYRYFRNSIFDEYQILANGAWLYSLFWFLFCHLYSKSKWMRFLFF